VIGSLFDYWKYTWADVWSPLARSRKAPSDLFIGLYTAACDHLRNPPDLQNESDYKQFQLIVNEPNQAKGTFEHIQAPDFGTETAIIGFMESAFVTILDFEIERYEKLYRWLVRSFLRKYNLRYRVDKPFRFRLMLPGVFADFYDNLSRLNRADQHLSTLMSDFEQTLGAYVRTKQACDLKGAIARASIYAEGVAAKTYGESGTLGALSDHMAYWPHVTVKESLKKLYGFCSDYPGIRHAGNPESKLRDLEARDAVVICLLLVSFSGYLTNDARLEEVVGL